MPVLHPSHPLLPPGAKAEQTVLRALRTLPPDCHVFVRLQILDPESNRDREIDFLVLHPQLGLVIIEVKGQGVRPDGDRWVREFEGQVKPLEETPGQQMAAQQYALIRHLRQAVGGFIPQVTRVLALPYLPVREGESLGPDLPACRLLTQARLARPFEALREAVTGGVPWATWSATEAARPHAISSHRLEGLIDGLTPGLVPPPPLAEVLAEEGRLQDEASQRLLDHLARNFCGGRFHVQGGPGSGKSLLARMAARIWASQGRRVLLVAFNRAITYATQTALDDLLAPSASAVTTFHDLAENLLKEAGRLPERGTDDQWYNHQLPEALAALLQEDPGAVREHWNALIVDEAQDLHEPWVQSLLGLLEDPEHDPVLILEDPAQSLFRRARHDLGQPWRLDLSLRQHDSLRRAACLAYPGCGWEAPEVGPDEGAIQYIPCSTGRWRQALAEALQRLANEGIQPRQVLILAPHRATTLGLDPDVELGPWRINTLVDWWEGEVADRVRFSTVHAFKGLEADVVCYLEPTAHEDAQRLAYTAYSRARHRLLVFERALPPRRDPAPASPPAPPVEAPRPSVKPFCPASLGEANRALILDALTAARNLTRQPTRH